MSSKSKHYSFSRAGFVWGPRHALGGAALLLLIFFAANKLLARKREFSVEAQQDLSNDVMVHASKDKVVTLQSHMGTYVEEILLWAKAQGLEMEESLFEIDYDPKSGATMIAKRHLDLHELIISVPKSMWVHHKRALASDIGPYLLHLEENLRTIVYLMRQKLKGDASDIWPYIQLLPSQPSSLLYFEDEDFEVFHNDMFKRWKKFTMSTYYTEYNGTFAGEDGLCVAHPQVFNCSEYTFDLYLWASLILYSRYFNVDGVDGITGVMLPVADLINHNSASLCNQDDDGFTFVHDTNTHEYVLKANEPFKKGSPLGICYNPRTNTALLSEYGFAMPNNRYDKMKFKGVFIKWTLDVESGQWMQSELCDKLKDDETQMSCQQLITRAVKEFLDSWPTTIKEDQTLLNGNTLTRNARSAVTWRLETKRLIAQALDGFPPIKGVFWTPEGRDLYVDDGEADSDSMVDLMAE